MNDSIQAIVDHSACGAKPVLCSAQVAPLSASDASSRCSTMPAMTISASARPTAFSSTPRRAGVSIWASALAAASNMEETGKAAERAGQGAAQASIIAA